MLIKCYRYFKKTTLGIVCEWLRGNNERGPGHNANPLLELCWTKVSNSLPGLLLLIVQYFDALFWVCGGEGVSFDKILRILGLKSG